MLETPFYHGCIRKAIILFGQLFADLKIERKDSAGNIQQKIKVPIAYGPKEKWLRRLQENPDGKKSISMELPRLSFEIVDYRYDPERKVGSNPNYFRSPDASDKNKKFSTPVPYNVTINLYVAATTQEDSLMIIEQILPYFAPGLVIEYDALTSPLTRTDITYSLQAVNIQDNWDGSVEEQRIIVHELTFLAKLYLFGPITEPKIIKRAIVDISTRPDMSNSLAKYNAEVNPFTVNNESEPHTIIDNWTN